MNNFQILFASRHLDDASHHPSLQKRLGKTRQTRRIRQPSSDFLDFDNGRHHARHHFFNQVDGMVIDMKGRSSETSIFGFSDDLFV